MNLPQQAIEQTKHVGDGAAVVTMVSALMGWLPAIAAGFTIVWTAIRIYETKTVQDLIHKAKKNEASKGK